MKRIFKITGLIFLLLLCMNYTWCKTHKDGNCYKDNLQGCFATNDTRIVTTIREFENNNEVHIECAVVGYIKLGVVILSLEYDPNIVYPIDGANGNEITTNLNGPVNMGDYLWLNPDLPGGANRWRAPSTTGQVNPKKSLGKRYWTFVKCAQLDDNFKLKNENDGEMVLLYKLFFRKKSGKTITNETFKYYNRIGAPITYNEIVHSTTTVRSMGQPAANVFVNPELFTRRSPSTIKTLDATVNGTNVILAGLAKSDGLTKIPGGNGLDWDKIIETGFIYSKNDIDLTIDSYSKKIKINNTEYDFPTIFETDASFTLGDYTFNMLITKNPNSRAWINMSETITGLDADETYYAYAYMKYKFQTSSEYPVLGERIEFTTRDEQVTVIENENKEPIINVFSYNNVVTIINKDLVPIKQVEITDMFGRIVWRGEAPNVKTEIALHVATGVYAVRIITGDAQHITTKVSINYR